MESQSQATAHFAGPNTLAKKWQCLRKKVHGNMKEYQVL